MTITKKDFSKIQLIISVALIVAALFYGASELNGGFSREVLYGNSESYFSWVYLLLVPAIIFFGLVWFIVNIVRYVKEKSYFSNNLRIRNIGGLIGLSWFFLTEIAVVILLAIHFDEICRPLSIWGNGSSDVQCSFFTHLFSLKDFEAGLVFYGSLLWMITVPIAMYIIGFLADWYTSKKIKASQVVSVQ